MSRSRSRPRLRPLHPRKSAVLSVLDVGGSKVVCLIARLHADGAAARRCAGAPIAARCSAIGHQRSRGVKGGAIVDLDAAESAIRLAVDAAERMAGVEVESVVVNMSGGRLGSRLHGARVAIGGAERSATPTFSACWRRPRRPAATGPRAALHLIPTGFSLDAQRGVAIPRGMVGDELGAELTSPPATSRRRAI